MWPPLIAASSPGSDSFTFSLIIAQIVIERRVVRLAALAGTVVSYGLLLSLTYQLVTGINDRTPYLWVGLMALPCLNVVTLLILNSKAINWLDPYDLEMGLIGPYRATIERLREKATMQEIERSARPTDTE